MYSLDLSGVYQEKEKLEMRWQSKKEDFNLFRRLLEIVVL